MYVDIKSWELLKKYIDDLYWDNDRLSSSGKYTLNHIDSMLNKIEEKYNNKIYVITSDYIYDDNGGSTIIGITLSTAHICAASTISTSFNESLVQHAINQPGY